MTRRLPRSYAPLYSRVMRSDEGECMTDRRDREKRKWEAEEERRAATERRGEELREAWRKHHPQEEEREKERPKKDKAT